MANHEINYEISETEHTAHVTGYSGPYNKPKAGGIISKFKKLIRSNNTIKIPPQDISIQHPKIMVDDFKIFNMNK